MAATIYTLDEANLFAGDDDPSGSNSNHLQISAVTLPNFEKNFVQHIAGGSSVEIEIGTHQNHLEVPFTLAGLNPQMLRLWESWQQNQNRFTIYGLVRDQRAQTEKELKAVVEGKLGLATPSEFQKGNLWTNAYAIRSIFAYTLWFDGAELWAWDHWEQTLRVNGVNRNLRRNQILRIPASA